MHTKRKKRRASQTSSLTPLHAICKLTFPFFLCRLHMKIQKESFSLWSWRRTKHSWRGIEVTTCCVFASVITFMPFNNFLFERVNRLSLLVSCPFFVRNIRLSFETDWGRFQLTLFVAHAALMRLFMRLLFRQFHSTGRSSVYDNNTVTICLFVGAGINFYAHKRPNAFPTDRTFKEMMPNSRSYSICVNLFLEYSISRPDSKFMRGQIKLMQEIVLPMASAFKQRIQLNWILKKSHDLKSWESLKESCLML